MDVATIDATRVVRVTGGDTTWGLVKEESLSHLPYLESHEDMSFPSSLTLLSIMRCI